MSKQARDPAKPPFPPWVFKCIMNPAITLILRSPLHGLMSKRLLLITFTGRKSGKQFTTPLGYEWWQDKVIVMTRRPWWRNFEGEATVILRFQGETRAATATAVTDPTIIAAYIRYSVEQNPAEFNLGRFGLTTEEASSLTQERLVQAAAAQHMIELELDK